jgi:CheY-like chemotaxis protein
MVDDLLDVMRLTRGKLELRYSRIDLRDVVRKTMDDHRPLFEQSGIELRVEHALGPAWIDADATRIAQVLGNLLQNSLKFTPSGGTVTVTMIADDGSVRLCVRDTGIGMAPGQVEKMFEPFAQGEQGIARTQGGLGLGLHLVKSMVELHGGSVSARSDGVGRGSEFVVSLPLARVAAVPARSTATGEVASARDILVIEDNPDAAQALADMLALDGHRVCIACNGRSGIALARERLPEVILCDVGLPDIDGYEVARAVRSDPALKRTRLVAVTGYAQPEDRQRAVEAGFDAHLPKPPPLDKLNEVLAETTSKKG